jgi:hypothetical protein
VESDGIHQNPVETSEFHSDMYGTAKYSIVCRWEVVQRISSGVIGLDKVMNPAKDLIFIISL